MKRILLGLVGVGWATLVSAQNPPVTIYGAVGDGTLKPVKVSSDGTLAGGGGLTTDADDGSIASGQTNSNSNTLTHVYSGSVWTRLTFGAAGTAATQVWTVQGIASMTPVAGNITQVAGATISGTNPFPVRAANSAGYIADDVAIGATDAGNPVPVGGVTQSAPSGVAVVASGKRSEFTFDTDNFAYARSFAKGDVVWGRQSNTDGTATSLIAAVGASVSIAVTDFTCVNSSATWVYVDLVDDAAGTPVIRYTLPVPPQAIGGGAQHTFATPLIGTANKAWSFDGSAAATTVYCSAEGYKVR